MLRHEASLSLLFKRIFIAAGIILAVSLLITLNSFAQVKWVNVDADYAPLPFSVQVFKTTDSLDEKPFIAFYVKARLKDMALDFTTDTTLRRRLTPFKFYEKNDKPLVVVNGTFFSFETNQNLNTVIKEGRILSHTVRKIRSKTDTTVLNDIPIVRGALGISKKRQADIAWVRSDSSKKHAYAKQNLEKEFLPVFLIHGDPVKLKKENKKSNRRFISDTAFKKWKMRTAIGGGPVLIDQRDGIKIFNEEEKMFTGKAINDKHPRTCMGYTGDGYLIIMVIQGRFPGIAEGATLEQEAKLLADLGCIEALNLDGGGSSCMLINGKETIKPSDKGQQRPVPAVFIITKK
ncbi:MAG: phosphodiester glycosidase family protein [Ferruginibacter sp.]